MGGSSTDQESVSQNGACWTRRCETVCRLGSGEAGRESSAGCMRVLKGKEESLILKDGFAAVSLVESFQEPVMGRGARKASLWPSSLLGLR